MNRIQKLSLICLLTSISCVGIHGGNNLPESTGGPATCRPDSLLIAASLKVERIPGVDINKVWDKMDTIETGDSFLKFRIYSSLSACLEEGYSFRIKNDSLVVTQKVDQCKRHTEGYGLRGDIEKLCPGQYTLVVGRMFQGGVYQSYFSKIVEVGKRSLVEVR